MGQAEPARTEVAVVKIRLRYIAEDVDRHGNVRTYFRRKGHPKIRLPGVAGSDEFMAAYKAALAGMRTLAAPKHDRRERAAKGSFRWLCESYFGSAGFKQLDARTQRIRRRLLDKMSEIHGNKPASRIEPVHIRRLRDEMADRPEAANSFLKTLRQLFAYSTSYGLMHYNPARDIPYISARGDGFHAWTEAEIAQFERTHPISSPARLAMALMLYTGQRRSDAIRLGRQHVREGRLEFTQHKNRARSPIALSIRIHPKLHEIIEANAKGTLQFIVTEWGKPFSDAGFGNRFRKWCDEAGLPNCTAHGLRKAATTRLAEAGCSEQEIMSITGHRTSKEVSRYARSVNRTRLAEQAMSKLLVDENRNTSVPLSDPVIRGGTLSASKTLKS
jgi:integrase